MILRVGYLKKNFVVLALEQVLNPSLEVGHLAVEVSQVNLPWPPWMCGLMLRVLGDPGEHVAAPCLPRTLGCPTPGHTRSLRRMKWDTALSRPLPPTA